MGNPQCSTRPRGSKKRVPLKLWLLALTVAVVILVIGGSLRTVAGIHHAETAADLATQLRPLVSNPSASLVDIDTLEATLEGMSTELRAAPAALGPAMFLSPALGWAPGVGPKLRWARDMLTLGQEVTDASLLLLGTAKTAAGDPPQPLLSEPLKLNVAPLQALSERQHALDTSVEMLDHAQGLYAKLSLQRLPSPYDQFLGVLSEALPKLRSAAAISQEIGRSWRSFLGFTEPRQYLVVAANADELRPAGGFIPGAWVMTLYQGQIVQMDFWDTVKVDNFQKGLPLPPSDLLRTLWGGAWLFRDAGWYPDFPTSAGVMERLFEQGTGLHVDGVMLADQWAVQQLLTAVGPVTLSDGQKIDGGSYISALEALTDREGRGFIDTLFKAFLQDMAKDSPKGRVVAVLSALGTALEAKHILLFFNTDEGLQQMAVRNNWAGALAKGFGDTLLVADSNVGINKANRNVTSSLRYRVRIMPTGEASARLELHYTNQGKPLTKDPCAAQARDDSGLLYEQLKNACYWDYLRVYVPQGTRLVSSSPLPMPAGALYRLIGYNDLEDSLIVYGESDRTVISSFFTVAPQESRSLAFDYALPVGVLQKNGNELLYSLVIQKQPGTLVVPLRFTLDIPDGFEVLSVSRSDALLNGGSVQWQAQLGKDLSIQVRLRARS